MKKILKNTIEMSTEVIDSIKKLKNAPMYGMGVFFPTIALGISCIGFATAYMTFIVHGGYGKQIQEIMAKGLDKSFTYGTVGMLYRGAVGVLTLLMLVISLVWALAYFFINETVIKKIVVVTDMVLIGLIAVFPYLVNYFWGEDAVSCFFNTAEPKYILGGGGIILCVCIMVIISMCITILTSVCSFMFRYICRVLIMAYGVIPIHLCLLENIVTIVALIAILLVLGVILRVFLASFSGSDASRNMGSRYSLVYKEQKVNKEAFQPKVKEFSGDVKFYRGKGGYGIFVPTDDCIYFSGNMEKQGFVCTVEEFEKGKIVIKLNGKQVTNIP